jgi:bifunctional N-acetylglucosamine-1-phosphate-uridyltransferase/glucosamine-1-phosphate-acetyltransferase GlmU-like protein
MQMPDLFAELPEVFAAAFDRERPWRLLAESLAAALDALPSERIEIGLSPDIHLSGDQIVIGPGTAIHPTVVIEGPIFIGAGVTIRPGAYLRGGCWLGAGAIVGANTEVKHSVFLPGAKAPHLAYVGDSILGSGVNLGAGTILSNFRHDGRDIEVSLEGERLPTGRKKLGAILGDRVLTGCNSVLHPGCIVGAGTEIYPGVQLRSGVYAANKIIKLRQRLESADKS